MKLKILPGLFFYFIFSSSYAQYCTPPVNSTGVFFNAIQFNLVGFTQGVTGGSNNFTSSNGYTDYSATSWGVIQRNCYVGIPTGVNNSTGSTQSINIRLFADWNNDNDFDDPGELVWDYDWASLATATSLGTGAGFIVPPYAGSVVRLRYALRQGGAKATACGGYTGEIEDYKLTLPANIAPGVSGSLPYIDELKELQITNGGVPLNQILHSAIPNIAVVTDTDPCIVEGIAVTAVNTPNGRWQYKIPAGSWTDFGIVSVANALLLSGEQSAGVRIRYIPTGPGTSTFTFKAWDQFTGANATYANTTTSGGTTAFSTSTNTASILTYSTGATAADVTAYMATSGDNGNIFNIRSASLDRVSGAMKLPEDLSTDAISGSGYDIDIDNANNKLIWVGGSAGTDLLRSNLDGTSVETLQSGVFSYPTGVASGGGKIFVADYSQAIYSFNADGSSMTSIISNPGTTTDIEFSNNKIYYVSQPGSAGDYYIMQANPDGTAVTQVYSSANMIAGLFVTSNSIYWTELDGSNNSYVKTKLLSGGTISDLITGSGKYYMDVQADEQHSLIYIISLDMPSYTKSRILTIPLAGGSSSRVLDLEFTPGSMVFQKTASTLPVRFIKITASRENKVINVEWNVGQEESLLEYQIERSADGIHFSQLSRVPSIGQSQYISIDRQPINGFNYYRVKAVNLDGSGAYSSIVKVSPNSSQSGITVYPTLVTDRTMNARLENMPAGNYRLQVYGTSGQLVYTKNISHRGGNSVERVSLPVSLSGGIYRVSMESKTMTTQTTIVIP